MKRSLARDGAMKRVRFLLSGVLVCSVWCAALAFGDDTSVPPVAVAAPNEVKSRPANAAPRRPSLHEVSPGLWVGDAAAAAHAPTEGFQAVLNMAQEIELTFPPETGITYRKMGLSDGSGRPIPPETLREAVAWLREEVGQGKKVLVSCQRGIGRSGSVAIGYVCALHPEWSYDQALAVVRQRHPHVLPHRGLRETVEALYPRLAQPRAAGTSEGDQTQPVTSGERTVN